MVFSLKIVRIYKTVKRYVRPLPNFTPAMALRDQYLANP
ncbi:hypothetical protein PCIT_a0742 [Pseudoalteromonas citrea]|uniref:Uncharacterized protein n=1 Tax=Pseudoalteromonas citrea TaxID=43655 RepID=A0AAD4ALF5_9GAMM|nr:hypothetical protein PCIT_a0742 [Pseudoalteromonas citrea]